MYLSTKLFCQLPSVFWCVILSRCKHGFPQLHPVCVCLLLIGLIVSSGKHPFSHYMVFHCSLQACPVCTLVQLHLCVERVNLKNIVVHASRRTHSYISLLLCAVHTYVVIAEVFGYAHTGIYIPDHPVGETIGSAGIHHFGWPRMYCFFVGCLFALGSVVVTLCNGADAACGIWIADYYGQ